MYPAMTSRNVEPDLAISICNLLETYYLEVIANAFVSKRLKLKMIENKLGKLSEPLLEGKKFQAAAQKSIKTLQNAIVFDKSARNGIASSIAAEKRSPRPDAAKIAGWDNDIITIDKRIADRNKKINDLSNDIIQDRADDAADKIKKSNTIDQDKINAANKIADDKLDFSKEKESTRKKEKEADEKFEKFETQSQMITYDPISIKDINLNPASTVLSSVDIEVQRSDNSIELIHRPLQISVQIVPQSTDHEKLEKILLQDYYSKFWKTKVIKLLRNVARWKNKGWSRKIKDAFKLVKQALTNNAGGSGKLNPEDEFKEQKMSGLFSSTSYLDASSFRYNKQESQYQIGTALVLFNLADLTNNQYEFINDGTNAFKKMFKMGWNSFVFIDEPNQVFYFISKFDNGLIKTMPFSLLFKATRNYDVFKDRDSLSKFTQPFNRRPKSFKSFLNNIIKKSKVNKHINSKLKKFKA